MKTIWTILSLSVKTPKYCSRVVLYFGDTAAILWLFLKKQLSKVDFPAFGEPTIAARKSFVAEAIALDAM